MKYCSRLIGQNIWLEFRRICLKKYLAESISSSFMIVLEVCLGFFWHDCIQNELGRNYFAAWLMAQKRSFLNDTYCVTEIPRNIDIPIWNLRYICKFSFQIPIFQTIDWTITLSLFNYICIEEKYGTKSWNLNRYLPPKSSNVGQFYLPPICQVAES